MGLQADFVHSQQGSQKRAIKCANHPRIIAPPRKTYESSLDRSEVITYVSDIPSSWRHVEIQRFLCSPAFIEDKRDEQKKLRRFVQRIPRSPAQVVYYLSLGATDNFDEGVISLIIGKLIQIIALAQEEQAAIVIPDYTTSSSSSKYIEIALRQAEFDGPVVNVGIDNHIACDASTFGQIQQSTGVAGPRGVVLGKATHSFQVASATMSHSTLAARLAKVLGGGTDATGDPGEEVRAEQDVVAVIAAADASVLTHMAELAREGIPMLVLDGSGGLCDRLPGVFSQRTSSAFDVHEASRRFCKENQLSEGTDRTGRWVRTILEDGNLIPLPLPHPASALQRALAAAKRRDAALALAQLQLGEYAAAARSLDRPAQLLLALKVVIGFVLTLLSAIRSQDNAAAAAVTQGLQQAATAVNQTLARIADQGPALHYAVVALPAVFTLVVSLARSSRPKYLALRYGAALVESEMYRYRTQTGEYSPRPKPRAPDAAAAAGGEEEAAPRLAAVDPLPWRAMVLSKKLLDIRANLLLFDQPGLAGASSPPPPADASAAEKPTADMAAAAGAGPAGEQEMVAADGPNAPLRPCAPIRGLEWQASELRLGVLRGDEYMERVRAKGRECEALADALGRWLIVYRFLAYTVGALGSIFTLIGLEAWVTVTTAFMTALMAIHASFPLEQRIEMLQRAVSNLEGIETQWQAVPSDRRAVQQYVDALVEAAESSILSLELRPIDYNRGEAQLQLTYRGPGADLGRGAGAPELLPGLADTLARTGVAVPGGTASLAAISALAAAAGVRDASLGNLQRVAAEVASTAGVHLPPDLSPAGLRAAALAAAPPGLAAAVGGALAAGSRPAADAGIFGGGGGGGGVKGIGSV